MEVPLLEAPLLEAPSLLEAPLLRAPPLLSLGWLLARSVSPMEASPRALRRPPVASTR